MYDKTLFAELFSPSKHSYIIIIIICNRAPASALCVSIYTHYNMIKYIMISSNELNNAIIICACERTNPKILYTDVRDPKRCFPSRSLRGPRSAVEKHAATAIAVS